MCPQKWCSSCSDAPAAFLADLLSFPNVCMLSSLLLLDEVLLSFIWEVRFSKKASSALLAFQNKHILLFWMLPAAIPSPGEKTSEAPLSPPRTIRILSFAALLRVRLSSKTPLSFCQSAELYCWMWLRVLIRAVMWLREAVLLTNYGASCCFWLASVLRSHISSHRSVAVLPNKSFPKLKVSHAASYFIPACRASFLAFDIFRASRWAESSPACDHLWKRAARQHAYFL